MNKYLKELAEKQDGVLYIEQVEEWIENVVGQLEENKEEVAGWLDDDVFLGEYRAYVKSIAVVMNGGADNANYS